MAARMTRTTWIVAIWNMTNTTHPFTTTPFRGINAERDARTYAALKEDQIKRLGWTHRVTVHKET